MIRTGRKMQFSQNAMYNKALERHFPRTECWPRFRALQT
jgi:hypothetical protein